MAFSTIFVILLMILLHPKTIQPVKRVMRPGGAIFYSNIEIGHPSMTSKTIFEFDRAENTLRNQLPNESEDSSYYVDVVFGPMLEFIIGGQTYELPVVFNPYYEPFLSTNLEVSVGMGPTSDIWKRFSNVTYTHNGIIFEDISPVMDRALEAAVSCDLTSTSLCDFTATVYRGTEIVPLSTNTTVRVGLGHQPSTFIPVDLYYAIKGELEISINDVADWPDITLCDSNMKCFQIRKELIYLRGHQYSDLTIKAWDENYIKLGTSLVLGLDFFFFRQELKMAVVPRAFILEYSYSTVLIIFFMSLFMLFMNLTSYEIGEQSNAVFPVVRRGNQEGVDNPSVKKIFIIARRTVEILIFIVAPIIMMTNRKMINVLINDSLVLFWFMVCLHVLFLIIYVIAGFYASLMDNVKNPMHQHRFAMAFIAMVRNGAVNVAIMLIVFAASLEIYAGETINQFHLFSSFGLSILVGSYLFGILMFTISKMTPKWFLVAGLWLVVFGLTSAVNILYFDDPYMDTILIGYGVISRFSILVFFLAIILASLISGIVISYPYVNFVYEGSTPSLKKTE